MRNPARPRVGDLVHHLGEGRKCQRSIVTFIGPHYGWGVDLAYSRPKAGRVIVDVGLDTARAVVGSWHWPEGCPNA